MKTIKDLVDFLSELDGVYPIPHVDKIVGVNEDVNEVSDYSIEWYFDNKFVDVSIFSNGHVSIYFGNGLYRKHEKLTDEVYAEIKTCLKKLYATNTRTT
jgi:tRNA G37 N-methylase Trm5